MHFKKQNQLHKNLNSLDDAIFEYTKEKKPMFYRMDTLQKALDRNKKTIQKLAVSTKETDYM